MNVYLCWARANPVGYEALDVTKTQDWRSQPNGGVPSAPFDPDAPNADDPLWLVGVNVQGVDIIGFDHIGPSIGADGRILVHAWNDDPVDWPNPWGITWSFANPRIDPRVGNRVNTEQYLTCWESIPGQSGYSATDSTTGGPVEFRPWADFSEPQANLTRHGIWIASDCENCPHTADDHVGGTGSACTFDDCTGYASLWQRHMDSLAATRPGWREYITP